MALFAEDDDWIKARLRLSNVPDSKADTQAIIAEAILRARVRFYHRLGKARVTALLALTDEGSTPTTLDGVLRALAPLVEVKLAYVECLRRLPAAFMDASGDLNQRWNEEAPFRERPRTNLERELIRLTDEIEQDMQMLAGEEAAGEESSIESYDGTPDDTAPLPGDSLFTYTTRCPAED